VKIIFSENAFKEYLLWQSEDKKTLDRINKLIISIQREGFMKGTGKPEPLKGIKAYSRRIDDENRLVYIGDNEQNLMILSCKGHYKD